MSSTRPRGFTFYLSCDINLQVRVRISDLQGRIPAFRKPDEVAALRPTAVCLIAKLCAAGETLGLETQTTYAETSASGCVWGEWLTFCVKYRDLPHDALLAIEVWEVKEGAGTPALLGGTTLPMFSRKGRLKAGPQRLKVWEGAHASVSMPSATPGKLPLEHRGPLGALERAVRRYNRGEISPVAWLDPLTMGEVTHMQQEASQAATASTQLQLIVDLPTFPHAVLYQQVTSFAAAAATPMAAGSAIAPSSTQAVAPQPAAQQAALPAGGVANGRSWSVPAAMQQAFGSSNGGAAAAGGAAAQGQGQAQDRILVLMDPEVGRDNPAELKAQKLARGLARGVIDRDLKPNSEERRRIMGLLRLPPNKPLHADEKALLWRFRFSLQQETRALTKFLQCVDWSDAGEARQAVELMAGWATIDTADALELLSPAFKSEEVRSHAVSVLTSKEDEELQSFLLQLVQALRYERADSSRLSRFLVDRALANPHFAIILHWYLFCEFEDASFGPRALNIHAALLQALTHQHEAAQAAALQRHAAAAASAAHGQHAAPLPTGPPGGRVVEAIKRQTELLSQLQYAIKELKGSRLKAARATARLREMVSEAGVCGELTVLRVPLPLDPGIMLDGIVPSECACFKSAQLPLRLHFKVDPHPATWPTRPPSAKHDPTPPHDPDGGRSAAAVLASLPTRTGIVVQGDTVRCCLIYKKGDDLRQDQFILQMIGLMDRLLKRESLDLRMTPYKVLPTSADDGLVELVPSTPLSRVLAEHRTVHRFFTAQPGAADPSGPFGLRGDLVETFVRSCAGYCVATYILGVGDRHLDNLMLCPDGRLFHIDFGYILGSDPKPFPPPMKICKEMVEAMGGQDSQYYGQFRMYACEAYNILRKNSDLILSLFHLMAGASIEAIRVDPEKAVLKLQEKFRLELDDEAAVQWMQALLNESATALMPQIVETTHRWAQYWR